MRIETTDDQAVTNTKLMPKGAAHLGVDWPDIEAQYRTLAPHAPIAVRKVESNLAAIQNLRTAADVALLVEELH